jgi:hypothetical protein
VPAALGITVFGSVMFAEGHGLPWPLLERLPVVGTMLDLDRLGAAATTMTTP